MNDDNAKREMEIVKGHTERLLEHFDSVQIFVTRNAPEEDGAVRIEYGGGNWFTRYGQVSAWKIREDESVRREVRGTED